MTTGHHDVHRQTPHDAPGHGQHAVHFLLDGEPYQTVQDKLTPNQIIKDFGHKDPATHYLVQIEGRRRISYEGKGDDPIKIQNGDRFQIVSTGPTPVS